MTEQKNDYSDDPFYGLGYTTPEDAEQYHAERLARQKLPIEYNPRRSGHVRSYESDRDLEPHMTMDEVRAARSLPRSAGAAAARAILREVQDEEIDQIAAGDETYARALKRARDQRRQGYDRSA